MLTAHTMRLKVKGALALLTRGAAVVMLFTTCFVLPNAHADGYLSRYGNGGGLSSHYGSGGSYYAGSGSGWNYGGAHAPTSHQHRAVWEQRQRNKQRVAGQESVFRFPLQNTWATRYSAAWYAQLEPAAGPTTYAPCGNYQRAPAACSHRTTRYVPLIERAN